MTSKRTCPVCHRRVSPNVRHARDLDNGTVYHLKCVKKVDSGAFAKAQGNQAQAVIAAATPMIERGAQLAAQAIQRRGIARTAQDVAQTAKGVKAAVGEKAAKNLGKPLKRKNAEKLAKKLEAGGYSVIITPDGKKWMVQIENPAWRGPRASGATARQESRRENTREPWMMQWLEDYIDSLEEEEYEVLDIIMDRARVELSPEKFEALKKEIAWIESVENPTAKGWEVIDSGGKQVGGPFETEQAGWDFVTTHGGPDTLSVEPIEGMYANPEEEDVEEFEAKYYPPYAPGERANPRSNQYAPDIEEFERKYYPPYAPREMENSFLGSLFTKKTPEEQIEKYGFKQKLVNYLFTMYELGQKYPKKKSMQSAKNAEDSEKGDMERTDYFWIWYELEGVYRKLFDQHSAEYELGEPVQAAVRRSAEDFFKRGQLHPKEKLTGIADGELNPIINLLKTQIVAKKNPSTPMDVEGMHMARLMLGKQNPEEQAPAQPAAPPPSAPTLAETQARINEVMARMQRGEMTEHEGVVAMREIMATSTPATQVAVGGAMIDGAIQDTRRDITRRQRAREELERVIGQPVSTLPTVGEYLRIPLPSGEEMARIIADAQAQVANIPEGPEREAALRRIIQERGGQAAQAMFQGPHGPYHLAYARLKPAVVKIVRDFIVRGRPWRGTAEEKQQKFEAVIKKLARHYEVRPPTLHISDPEHAMGSGFYNAETNHIELPHYSVVTLLHEFKHALQHLTQQPQNEEVARGWSLSLFYKAAPKHFKRAVERAIIFFITPPDLEGRPEPMFFSFAESPSPALPMLAPLKARLEEMGYRTELRDGMAKLQRDGEPTQAKLLYTNAPGFVVDRALKYNMQVPDGTYRGEVDSAQMRIDANPRRKGKAFVRGRFEIRPSGRYIREKVEDEGKFDKRSFRTIERGAHMVVIGCPAGQWDSVSKRCRVGTKAQSILHPLSEADKYGFEAEELVAAGIPMAPPPEVVEVLENPDPYYYSSEAENVSPEAIGKGAGAAAEVASMAATGAAMGSVVPGVGTAIGAGAGAGAAVAKQAYEALKERKRKKVEAAAAAAPKTTENPEPPQALIDARDLM